MRIRRKQLVGLISRDIGVAELAGPKILLGRTEVGHFSTF
jgi:hypothetical protein